MHMEDWFFLSLPALGGGVVKSEFGAYVSTQTVGKQWPSQAPKRFSENTKTLSAKWFCFYVNKQEN
jgi:hypothetical protein